MTWSGGGKITMLGFCLLVVVSDYISGTFTLFHSVLNIDNLSGERANCHAGIVTIA